MQKSVEESINVAEAKEQLSNLLGRVAFGRETILITRRGRPMAKLVPPDEPPIGKGLGSVRGWLPDDDPFFPAVEEIVNTRLKHRPRTSRKQHAKKRR